MHPFRFLFAILSVFTLSVAGSAIVKRTPGTDNYAVLTAALQKAGKPIDPNKRYGLYEYFAVDGQWNCNKYFTHVALVIGNIVTGSNGPEFRGQQFEMRKRGDGGSGGVQGEQTVAQYEENWWANHYHPLDMYGNKLPQWIANAHKHVYELAGEVGESPFLEIRGLGADYIRDHPTYNVVTNSCQTYAGWLFKQVKK
ncbi:hypothetical protein JX266_011359 [Neoarthrinium moseri]|nr:hypothetical protein JX266_011359 [Neoarthrinium moseri]